MSDVIGQEQYRYNLQHPSNRAPPPSAQTAAIKPAKSGYEKYSEPDYIPEITAKSSVWGSSQQNIQQPFQSAEQPKAAPSRKMMSLEEVEAAMRVQSQATPPPAPQRMPQQPSQFPPMHELPTHMMHQRVPSQPHQFHQGQFHPQFHPHEQMPPFGRGQLPPMPQMPQHMQQQMPPQQPPQQPMPTQSTPQAQQAQLPLHILQNPSRAQAPPAPEAAETDKALPVDPKGASALPVITHPQQMLQLNEDQRKAYLIEDAKRAKRNHKIYLLSKGNGLMTPQDKNYITRIQLQQLVSATGTVTDNDSEAAIAEDFYYQVYSQIRGAPRQHPHQPLGHFAQTYLFQTGGRTGGGSGRRQYLNGDNHMQRMQQQVQRAVEAAKLRPKNKQLIIEGSLGKISFSNAKTPKPMLNIKRRDSEAGEKLASSKKVANMSASDRKSILRNIENVYSTLMEMENHERKMPPMPESGDAEAVEAHMLWSQTMSQYNKKLWNAMKVMEPIVPNATTPHPFIAFLSYSKGKKAIPRIFRHLDPEQRVTVLTIIVVQLDTLDVVQKALVAPGETQLPFAVRDEIELFSHAVMPSLLGYVSEAPVNIVIGLLGLVLQQTNVHAVARTKVGLGILTMLLSRAELVKEAGGVQEHELQQWTGLYNRLFDSLEPVLAHIFPGNINSADDMYVWQFLAAVGIGASPEQQQRLVIAVK